MHQPSTGVIGWEGNDDISACISSVGVATDGIVEVECGTSTTSTASSNDPEILRMGISTFGSL